MPASGISCSSEKMPFGVNPKNETVGKDTLCRKGTASAKETVFEGIPADGSGAVAKTGAVVSGGQLLEYFRPV